MKKAILSAVVAAAAMLGAATIHASEWQAAKESNGVEVMTRTVEGTSLKAFRGVTRINASLSALVAAIEDVPGYVKWMHNIREAKFVSDQNPTRGVIYLVQKTPIVSDRDLSLEYRVTREGAGVRFDIREKMDAVPPNPKYVRVPSFKGVWKLTPKGDEVEVVYEVQASPGGSVPASVANAVAVDVPFHTLNNLRTKVDFSKYEGKNLVSLK